MNEEDNPQWYVYYEPYDGITGGMVTTVLTKAQAVATQRYHNAEQYKDLSDEVCWEDFASIHWVSEYTGDRGML